MKNNFKTLIAALALAALVVPGTSLAVSGNAQGNNTNTTKPSVKATPKPVNTNDNKPTIEATISPAASTEAAVDLNKGKKDWKTLVTDYKQAAQTKKLEALQKLGETLIQNRISFLNNIVTKTESMKGISDEAKTQIKADVQKSIAELNALLAKIKAETDAVKLKAEIKSIFDVEKIYSVVAPKTLGEVAVARSQYILGRLTALETKLETIVSEVTDSATKTEIDGLVTNFEAKLTDAKAQLDIANTKFKTMSPLKTAEAKTAQKEGEAAMMQAKQDLKDAHDILQSIIEKLKAVENGSVSPSASPSATASTSPSVSTSASLTASPTATATQN